MLIISLRGARQSSRSRVLVVGTWQDQLVRLLLVNRACNGLNNQKLSNQLIQALPSSTQLPCQNNFEYQLTKTLSDQGGDQLTKTLQSKKNWCSEHKRVSWQQIKCLQNSVNDTKLVNEGIANMTLNQIVNEHRTYLEMMTLLLSR